MTARRPKIRPPPSSKGRFRNATRSSAAAMSLSSLGPAVLLLLALPPSTFAQCPDQTFDAFEAQGYSVRTVRVSGPPASQSLLRDTVVASMVSAGAPVAADGIEAGKAALRKALLDTPSLFESRVAATIVIADVEACDQVAKTLDVVYRVFTTKVPLAASRTIEGYSLDVNDPAARLGVAAAPVRARITPLVRYNSLEHLVGGGRVSLKLPRIFDQLSTEVT